MENCVIGSMNLDEDNKQIVIKNITISKPMLYNFLVTMEEEKRKQFIEHILFLGFEVAQIMDQTSRVDYVKSEFNRMKEAFDSSFNEVFSDTGTFFNLMEAYFGQKGEVTDLLSRHFGDEGSVLCNILNHTDESTPLGKFRKELQSMLDITNEETVFYKLKKCVEEGLNDLNTKMELKERVTQAVAKERLKGTQKGRDFQEFLTEITDQMASPLEDTVTFVGDDTGLINSVGDILIQINPSNTKSIEKSIIIEAKKSAINLTGKNSFLKELDRAMENRASVYAIGAVSEEHTPNSVGEFRRYSGNKIIVNIPKESYPLSLEIAYKVARAEIISKTLTDQTEIDLTKFLDKINNIRGELEVMMATKRSLTTAKGNIDTAYDNLETMEKNIKRILNELTAIISSEETTEKG